MTKFFIKVVYAILELGRDPILTSLSNESYWSIHYEQGRWVKPTLKDSKIFIFQNMQGAFDFLADCETPYRQFRGIPFQGKLLWWCEAHNVTRPEQLPLRGPTDSIIERYWNEYPFFSPEVPRCYQMSQSMYATLFADEIKLVQTVTPAEIKRLLHG